MGRKVRDDAKNHGEKRCSRPHRHVRHYRGKHFKNLRGSEGSGCFIVGWLVSHEWRWQRVRRREWWVGRGGVIARVIYPTAFETRKGLRPHKSKEQPWGTATELPTV